MAFLLDYVGTQQQVNAQLAALASSTGRAQEVAALARMVSMAVNEVNAYPMQAPYIHIVMSGSSNLDAEELKFRIENVTQLPSGTFYASPVNPATGP